EHLFCVCLGAVCFALRDETLCAQLEQSESINVVASLLEGRCDEFDGLRVLASPGEVARGSDYFSGEAGLRLRACAARRAICYRLVVPGHLNAPGVRPRCRVPR